MRAISRRGRPADLLFSICSAPSGARSESSARSPCASLCAASGTAVPVSAWDAADPRSARSLCSSGGEVGFREQDRARIGLLPSRIASG